MHTDIVATGWVARMPRAWLPYLLLARVDRPIGTWLLFLPGLWGILLARAPTAETIRLVILFAVGSLVMRAAGCVVNDLWDREIDRKVARTAGRPLASGALRPRHALNFPSRAAAGGFGGPAATQSVVAGAGSRVTAAGRGLSAGQASDVVAATYDGLHLRFGAPMGYAAAAGRLDAAWVALYAAAILWDLGFDTIYAHQDREDDALVGVHSTARLFGENTRPFLAVCYAAAVAALGLAGWLAALGLWFYPVLVLPAGLLARQVMRAGYRRSGRMPAAVPGEP